MHSLGLSFVAFVVVAAIWPVLLVVALGLGIRAVFVRGRTRAVLVVLAVLFALPGLRAGIAILGEVLRERRERVEDARTHTRLAEPRVVDGIALPAGAVVQWADASHARMDGAEMNPAAEMFGVRVRFLMRFDGGRWSVVMEDAATLEGWPCAAPHASFNAGGRLLSCTLARDTPWQGWVLPERTQIDLDPDEPQLSLMLPAAVLEAPGVGRLPYNVVLHGDGSVAEARYRRDAPLRVGDHLLWDDVRWNYGPGTGGQGRARVPVSVSGLPMEAEDASRDEGQRVVLPLPPP